MNQQALCEKLGIDADELAEYVAQGMPRAKVGRSWEYDEQAIARWIRDEADKRRALLNTGPVANTIDQAVRLLAEAGVKVHKRTFQDWMKQEGFPGRAGTPGKPDGDYPIHAILEWIGETRKDRDEAADGPRNRVAIARANLLELELEKERGAVVSRDEALRAMHRQSALFLGELESLPHKIALLMPPEYQPTIIEATTRMVATLRESVADQMEQEDIAKQEGNQPSTPVKETPNAAH